MIQRTLERDRALRDKQRELTELKERYESLAYASVKS